MQSLETTRLTLRKLEESDFNAIHSYASSKENTIYMLFGPNNEDDTRGFIKKCLAKSAQTPILEYNFAIVLKKSGQLIGSCDLHFEGNTGEIGWLLHRDYWRQGYGTEIGRRLLELGFDELNLHRIKARCHAENIGSSRLMEKIGMRREGLFLDARPPHKNSDRAYGDEFRYAILKDEWDIQKEIACFNASPCEFTDFIDVPMLTDGTIYLVCTKKTPAEPEKKWVPAYHFFICWGML